MEKDEIREKEEILKEGRMLKEREITFDVFPSDASEGGKSVGFITLSENWLLLEAKVPESMVPFVLNPKRLYPSLKKEEKFFAVLIEKIPGFIFKEASYIFKRRE